MMDNMKDEFFNRRVVAGSISVLVLSLLFLAGPVQAFVLGLTADNLTPNVGDNVSFEVSVAIENVDKFLPVRNLSLVLTGPSPLINAVECIFDVDGNILEGCEGMSIYPVSSSYSEGFGYDYGYGYDSNYGYGYDFGYGYGYDNSYGYGYDYGYGYGKGFSQVTLRYNVVLDTTDYSEGVYDSFLKVRIGSENFDKGGPQLTIGNASVVLEDEEEEEQVWSFSSHYSSFVAPPINLTNSGDEDGEEGNGTVLGGVTGDDFPEGGIGSFFSGITGAVIGALGSAGAAGVGIFIVAILGSVGFIRYKRRRTIA